MMTNKPKSTLDQLLPIFIQAGVGIFFLLIVLLVVSYLPMIKEIDFPLRFSLFELIKAVILTIIAIMLFNFGRRMGLRIGYMVSRFPQSGTMVKLFVFMIAVLVLYFAYIPLVIPYMENLAWIYHLLILFIFLFLLGSLGYTIYSNADVLKNLISGSSKAALTQSEIICANCGEKNKTGTKFCSFCGKELPQPLKCSSCGAILKQNAKFCPNCGATVGEASPKKSSGPESAPKKEFSAPVCASCGAILKKDAKFCPSCGLSQK